MSKHYLTEDNLGKILEQIKPDLDFIHDKSVPNAKNKRRRPDYRNEKLKLIIEFDGDSHYRNTKRIISDVEKDNDYISLGYKVFRIPYFIQISETVLYDIFNEKINFSQVYPNGFIDSKVVMPADFCELGIKLFMQDLERFSYHKKEIIDSLKKKYSDLKNIDLIVPPSLRKLIV